VRIRLMPSDRSRNPALPRRPRLVMLAVLPTLAGLLAVSPASAAQPAAAHKPARSPETVAAGDAQTLAAQQARRTGKPVTVTSLTTPTSVTQALPDGLFRLTTSSTPVRAWTGREWQALDATLRRDSGGRWSAAVAAEPVSVSGGGSGPLAVMTTEGRTLSLYWPRPLPRPQVSGSTAVYPSVLPGADLRVSVTAEGGFRDVLVIKNRAAAASPMLRRLVMTVVTTGGLHLTAGPGGMLLATSGGRAVPAFTAAAPLMWDSATSAVAPPGTSRLAGTPEPLVDVPGAPASSSAATPGRHAHAAWVRTEVSAPRSPGTWVTRQALTLIPDLALLTSPAAVYPAYIDPTWYGSGGSRGWYASDDDYYTSDNWYDKTADPQGYLQVGDGGQFNAHTFVEMNLDSGQLKDAVIHSSVLQMTEETSWSCTATPVELWWAGTAPTVNGSPWVSWGNEPAWKAWNGPGSLSDGAITSVTAAHGYSGCPAAAINFDITSFMQYWGPGGPSSVTFGLKAPDLNDTSEWKEFSNASGAITMTTYYAHYPNPQADSLMSPGGLCQSVATADTIVGNDDITLETTPSDPDGGYLSTEFVVTPYGSTSAKLDTTVSTTSGQPTPLVIPRTTIQGWYSDGTTTAHTYAWYTITTDQAGLSNSADTGIGSKSKPCLFTFDPSGPQTPGIGVPPPVSGSTDGAVGTLGGSATFTFGLCSTSLENPPAACSGNTPAPVKFVYQVNDGPQVTIPVTATSASPTQTVTLTLSRVGPNTITVTGLSAGGNPGGSASGDFNVDGPATPAPDGDYAGTGHPDLITVGDGTGSAAEPGVWMAESDGTGQLDTPIDIGARGTGASTTTVGTPADWAGTDVLHGNFARHNVQDIVAYYTPSASTPAERGSLALIDGPGTRAPLDPESDTTAQVTSNPLGDPYFPDPGDMPVDVVAAGNASLRNTGLPDLIGILGDSTINKYELNLYTAQGGDLAFNTGYGGTSIVMSNPTPPSISTDHSWGPQWTLEVAQPSGTAPVLLALDRSTGQLLESAGMATSSSDTAHLTGMPSSTWTQVTGGPWGAGSGPALVQADVNSAGKIELWTVSGSTATAWTISGTALTREAVNTLTDPAHDWPLTDGPAETPSSTGTVSLVDTQSSTGSAAATGVTFTGDGSTAEVDPVLGPVAQFANSATSSLTLPAGILQDTTAAHTALQSMTLTMRFLAQPGQTGILAGTSTGNLTDTTLSNASAPILYIGTDGRLYAQFPSGHLNTSTGIIAPDITPLTSPGPVTDGQWHTVTLVADGATHDQILYLDNHPPVHLAGNGYIDPSQPSTIINPGQTTIGQDYGADQVTIGAGIFSDAGWINADATRGASGTTRLSYFTGDISGITYYPQALAQAQIPNSTVAPATSTITSANNPFPCIDNHNNTLADGNKVDVWSCNGSGAQNWTFQPDGTITIAPGWCLDVTGGGTSDGTLVDLHSCDGSGAQQWQLISDDEIMNPASGKCVNDPSGDTSNGTQLQIYPCKGDQNSTWANTVLPAESPATGTIVSVQSGRCATNAGGGTSSAGSTSDGNPIQVNDCSGWLSQQWTFEPDGTIHIAGKCLDNKGSGTTNGNLIDLWTCNGGSNQQWAHFDDGALYNPASGMCIDGGANQDGTQIQIWSCNQTGDQTWIAPDTYNHT
jgi:hypothetical protein